MTDLANDEKITIDFLVLPADIQEKIKKAFDLTVEKADVLDETITPDSFPYGGGKKAIMLEYGVACVNLDTEQGFGWVFTQHFAYAKCKNSSCKEIKDISTMVKTDTDVYCSDKCKEVVDTVPE